MEHSIENQLPFLQYCEANAASSCRIAPISVGWLAGAQEVEGVAAAVAAVLRRHPPGSVVLVATTDFTHAVRPGRRRCNPKPWVLDGMSVPPLRAALVFIGLPLCG